MRWGLGATHSQASGKQLFPPLAVQGSGTASWEGAGRVWDSAHSRGSCRKSGELHGSGRTVPTPTWGKRQVASPAALPRDS